MDGPILVTAIFALIVFLVVHAVVYRCFGDRKVFSVILAIWFIIATSSFVVGGILAAALFGLSAFSYILAIFGTTMTSVRIQILMAIARAGKRGIAKSALRRQFTRESVINDRLRRLIASGEIQMNGTNIRPGKRFSYFLFHTYLVVYLVRLFGNKHAYHTP